MSNLTHELDVLKPSMAEAVLISVLRDLDYSARATADTVSYYHTVDSVLGCPSVEPEDQAPLERLIRGFDSAPATWDASSDAGQWLTFDSVDRVARPIDTDNESSLEVEELGPRDADLAWAAAAFNVPGNGDVLALVRSGANACREADTAEVELRKLGAFSLGLAERIAGTRNMSGLD